MKYQSQGEQLTIEGFRSLLANLFKSNRWVCIGDFMTWSEIEINHDTWIINGAAGAGNKLIHMIVGTLIIKHMMFLSD